MVRVIWKEEWESIWQAKPRERKRGEREREMEMVGFVLFLKVFENFLQRKREEEHQKRGSVALWMVRGFVERKIVQVFLSSYF